MPGSLSDASDGSLASGTAANGTVVPGGVVDSALGAVGVIFHLSATDAHTVTSTAVKVTNGDPTVSNNWTSDPALEIEDQASGKDLSKGPRPVTVWGYLGTAPLPWQFFRLDSTIGGTDIAGFMVRGYTVDPAR